MKVYTSELKKSIIFEEDDGTQTECEIQEKGDQRYVESIISAIATKIKSA